MGLDIRLNLELEYGLFENREDRWLDRGFR
jgi:hypothetical protein